MPKLTPKRTFLLRHEAGRDTIARKGVKIEVTEEEHKRLNVYFVEPFASKKRGLTVN